MVSTPGAKPTGLVLLDRQLWVFDQSDGSAAVVNTSTAKVAATFTVTARSGFAAAGFGSIWVPDFTGTGHAVDRVDPRTHSVTATYPTGGAELAVATGAGSVWITENADNTVIRLDPATGKVVASISVPSPTGVLVHANQVWVASYTTTTLTTIDATTNAIRGSVSLSGPGQNILASATSLWVSQSDGSLTQITPTG